MPCVKCNIHFVLACHVTVVHLFDINHNNISSHECLVELEFESDVKDALKRSSECIDRKEIEGMKQMRNFIEQSHHFSIQFDQQLSMNTMFV